ncbi:MAG: DUF5678 domain-containing protein [Candidatus Thorarchaeota archaeon]
MVIVKGTIPEELDQKFRKMVAKRYGLRKGAISSALEEAVRDWVENIYRSKSHQQLRTGNSFRDELIDKYPNKYVIIDEKEVLTVADSVVEATQEVRRKYPERDKFTLIHAVPKTYSRRQLGWRIRRRNQ